MRRRIRRLKLKVRRLKRRLSNSWIGRLVIGGWQWITNLPNSTAFWLALVGTILLGSIIGIVFGGWDWLRETELNSLPESRSTTLRNAGLVIAGALALVFAVWRGVLAQRQAETAQRQSETSQQGLLNERYQKGAEMLGSEVLSVRLGGIYALQRLAAEHPEQYHVQILKLFCAFVRNPTGVMGGHLVDYDEDGEPIFGLRVDVQEVMRAIGSRTDAGIALERADRSFELDLQNVDLQRCDLLSINLSEAILDNINLYDAVLNSANLCNAFLGNANMSNADLIEADLSSAHLSEACLSGARLSDSDLSNASLSGADLSNAYFDLADLTNASLSGADLSNASFSLAGLANADFSGANLTGADLEFAGLTGASFNGRKRLGDRRSPAIGLTQAQLDKAWSYPDNPPDLEGVLDAETGEQLVWRGRPLDDDSAEPDA